MLSKLPLLKKNASYEEFILWRTAMSAFFAAKEDSYITKVAMGDYDLPEEPLIHPGEEKSAEQKKTIAMRSMAAA